MDSTPPPRKKTRMTPSLAVVPAAFQRTSVVAAVKTATCEAVPMCNATGILDSAQDILLTNDGASWLYFVPQWYQRLYALHVDAVDGTQQHQQRISYSEWFDAVWRLHPRECGTIKLFGKEIRTPRFQQAYGVTHRFSGATFPAQPFPDILKHAVTTLQRMLVDPTTNATLLEAGLLNWYADGDHYMGPHSDKGVNVHPNSPIFSLTLGPATRRFVFTPRRSKGTDSVELQLSDGDLLVMGGTTQATHKHALPKMKRCRDRRVNVTLRYFK